MKTVLTAKIGRRLIALAAVAAITVGSLGIAANQPSHADAALKWSEQAVKWDAKPTKDKTKKSDLTSATIDTATSSTTTP